MSLGTILPLCFLEHIRGNSSLRIFENYRQNVAASQVGSISSFVRKGGGDIVSRSLLALAADASVV